MPEAYRVNDLELRVSVFLLDIETCNWIQIEGCLTVLAKAGFAKHLELKAQVRVTI